jgi:uncharacterized membrane protein
VRINETKKRSLYKALSFRVIEIAVDTGAIYLVFNNIDRICAFLGISYLAAAFWLAVLLEAFCFGLHYCFERLWNRTDFGRHTKEDK